MDQKQPARIPDSDEPAEAIVAWGQRYSRELMIGAIAVVVVAAGGLIYVRSSAQKSVRAESALISAAELMANDSTAGKTQLDQVAQRYGGTVEGELAVMLLANQLYGEKKFQEGVQHLEAERTAHPNGILAPAVSSLIGAGYDELGNAAAAATAYQEAAKESAFDEERQPYLASAATALTAGGNTTGATAIWHDLASKAQGTLSTEAKLRLGELEVKAAKSGGG